MAFTDKEIDIIWERTNRRCHICRKTIARRNYGTIDRRGSWEVDHSNPRAKGGTDRLSNLLPACIKCNRRKQDGSTRNARAEHGHSRRPLSAEELERAQAKNILGGAAAGGAAGALVFGFPGFAVGSLVGMTAGSFTEIEE